MRTLVHFISMPVRLGGLGILACCGLASGDPAVAQQSSSAARPLWIHRGAEVLWYAASAGNVTGQPAGSIGIASKIIPAGANPATCNALIDQNVLNAANADLDQNNPGETVDCSKPSYHVKAITAANPNAAEYWAFQSVFPGGAHFRYVTVTIDSVPPNPSPYDVETGPAH